METATDNHEAQSIWGPYPNYDDIARLVYGRRMWRLPEMRGRLLAHWTDERHPYKQRFEAQRTMLEEVLASNVTLGELDARVRLQGSTLRCVAREIPPVFGSFF